MSESDRARAMRNIASMQEEIQRLEAQKAQVDDSGGKKLLQELIDDERRKIRYIREGCL